MQYRADIDGLRAVAVVPVVLFHAQLGFPGGFVGVDVFFVISGFLITSILLETAGTERFSLLDFYERRARRIFPALFAMIFATLLVGAWLMIPSDFASLGKSALATLLFVSNVLFFLEVGYFDLSAHLKPLLHTWSLAVEEQYYLLFPIALHLVARRASRRIVLLALVVGAGVSLALMLATADTRSAFFLLPARCWELALGAILAAAPSLAPRTPRQAEALALLGAAALLAAIFALDDRTSFPGPATLLPCFGAAALIAAGRSHATAVSRLLATGPFVWVGRLSYSLYLWHWPVIVFGAYGALHDPGIAEKLGAVVLSFLLAMASLRLIETPVRRRRLLGSRRAIFAGSGVGFAAIAALGATILVSDGMPSRISPEAAQILTWRNDPLDRALDCDYVSEAQFRSGRFCTAGAEGAPPVFALVGDSHSDAWAPGVFSAAAELGVSGYQLSIAGFRPYTDDFHAETERMIEALRALPVETVLLIGFWSAEATGFNYRMELSETPLPVDGLDRRMLDRLDRFVTALPEKTFVIFDDNPVGQPLDRFSLARHVNSRSGDYMQGVPRERIEIYSRRYGPAFQALAERHANVRYLPAFVDALCRDKICPRTEPQLGSLYLDGDHVSVAGAISLAPVFRKVLAEATSPVRD